MSGVRRRLAAFPSAMRRALGPFRNVVPTRGYVMVFLKRGTKPRFLLASSDVGQTLVKSVPDCLLCTRERNAGFGVPGKA